MADELFEVRNLFTLGNYAGAVNAAISLRPSSCLFHRILRLFF